eukprot:TRINITY_DN3633_c0_g1_i2.p2 TRINITY_DN3633_c0_g1~~TRINITY_DN3633_c0_g1_i2.p2  ORF type:complete len:110 (-),score=37.50 TRINITY_DN3633_c0_g1_i2:352-681(-)
MEIKERTSVEVLCEGLPSEIRDMLEYVRKLRFEEDPNYSYIKGLLRDVFVRERFDYDFKFDWNMQRPSVRASAKSEIHILHSPRKQEGEPQKEILVNEKSNHNSTHNTA